VQREDVSNHGGKVPPQKGTSKNQGTAAATEGAKGSQGTRGRKERSRWTGILKGDSLTRCTGKGGTERG